MLVTANVVPNSYSIHLDNGGGQFLANFGKSPEDVISFYRMSTVRVKRSDSRRLPIHVLGVRNSVFC
jgi:hypothetical protein